MKQAIYPPRAYIAAPKRGQKTPPTPFAALKIAMFFSRSIFKEYFKSNDYSPIRHAALQNPIKIEDRTENQRSKVIESVLHAKLKKINATPNKIPPKLIVASIPIFGMSHLSTIGTEKIPTNGGNINTEPI